MKPALARIWPKPFPESLEDRRLPELFFVKQLKPCLSSHYPIATKEMAGSFKQKENDDITDIQHCFRFQRSFACVECLDQQLGRVSRRRRVLPGDQ